MYFLLSKSSSYNLQCKHRHFDSATIFVSSEQSSDEQMMVRPGSDCCWIFDLWLTLDTTVQASQLQSILIFQSWIDCQTHDCDDKCAADVVIEILIISESSE